MSDFSDRENPNIIVLFDVDGTLTPARQTASSDMIELLKQLRKKVVIGFVGGSDLIKQQEQLGLNGVNVIDMFDFCFAENGLTAYRLSKQLSSDSFIKWIGEEKYQKLIKWILNYITQLNIPIMRGTFIEFRNGMINVSPIGRNASIEERNEFEKYDKIHNIRKIMVEKLQLTFPDYGLTYSIGGQISFDVFPKGWDKTYCLQHIQKENFKEIHFFGDKTHKGGNDFEIFSDHRVLGHSVSCPNDTKKIINELFF